MAKRELLTRALTGFFVVAITLAAIIYSPYTFLAFLALIAFGGTREYFTLDIISPNKVMLNIIAVVFAALIFIAGYIVLKNQNPALLIIMLPVMIALLVLVQLLTINSPEEITKKGKSIYAAASYIILPLLCGTIFLMGDYSYRYVLIPVIMIWVNDIGAYLFGSTLGTTKIKPSVSPGKSLQGTLGGIFVTLLSAFIIYRLWPDISSGYIILLALVIPIIALTGDFWESALKRNAGVKDSGDLLPGHGGILDRYDSLLFVLPFAAIAYYIFVL